MPWRVEVSPEVGIAGWKEQVLAARQRPALVALCVCCLNDDWERTDVASTSMRLRSVLRPGLGCSVGVKSGVKRRIGGAESARA